MRASPVFLWLALCACLGSCSVGTAGLVDFDGDGVVDADDCAPADAEIYPGAGEDCTDQLDNDCDGAIDADDGDCA